jgi:hypothetical protein
MTKKQLELGGHDPREEVLEPHSDVLLHLEVPDELLKYYLSLSRATGMVYALAVKQLINRMYRDHDYTRRRKLEGRCTGYDAALERDQQALAWLISAAALYVPEEVKRHPIPPRPPRPRRATPRSKKAAGATSHVGMVKEGPAISAARSDRPRDADALVHVRALLDAAQALDVDGRT